MPPPPTELLLPAALDGDEAVALLAGRLRVERGRARTVDRTLLDSFDGRLRKAGLRAERTRGRDGSATLALHEPGAPLRRAAVPVADRHLAAELPAGPLRDRLAAVLEERALLPRVRVRSSLLPLAVLDGEAKTVVRMAIERAEAIDGSGRRPLAPRLSVQAVLGYDAAHEQALRVLRERLGLEPAGRSLYDEAVRAVGGRPRGISTKPKVTLASGTPSGEAAGLVLGRLAEIAEVNLEGAQADLDTEFLHDLRVSVRRARSVLKQLGGVHDPGDRAHLRAELKWAQKFTGPVRDLDVQLLEWDDLVAPLAPEPAGDLHVLRSLLERRRASELDRTRRALRSKRFRATLNAWRALAGAAAGPDAGVPIELLAGERIRSVHRKMVRDGRRIDDDTEPEALHDLRKRGKELRYLLELFGSVYDPEAVKPLVSTLKGLQAILGTFQDRAVQVETLRALGADLAAEPDGPAALLALGPALDGLLASRERARADFAHAFEPFAAKDQRALVKATFPKR